NVQRLMVMDGGTAMLSSVQTQPLRLRQVVLGPYGKVVSEGYVYRSLGGGVRVTPRSRGEMVVIEIGAEEARPLPGQYQATEVMQLSTQVSGRMGEWIMLGDDQRSGGGGGWLRVTTAPYCRASAPRHPDSVADPEVAAAQHARGHAAVAAHGVIAARPEHLRRARAGIATAGDFEHHVLTDGEPQGLV